MTQTPKTEPMTRSQLLVAMAVTALVLMVIAKGWSYLLSVQIVPLRWQVDHFAIGIGLGVGVALLSTLVYEYWEAYREAAKEYLEMVLKPLNLVDLIWLGLLPGMSEELLFRGVAIPGLGMNMVALIVSSVVFGALHMASIKHIPYTIWATIVGLLLGSVTLATGNLLPAIVAHVFTNSLSGLLWKLRHPQLSS
ncbi:CPBP family intramembrane glutamic endopeptidase [Tumidithrix elongata RA019]|uniref:CPBP family intramembrane glutamic endopeptidase n=1 Tax=Tumidithrix elongata BACA0141 TaxID=2716417 RepID=A0AAW9PU21_9CYAN|nr:CPBP family intramembrane glutamic endopeptidase [Tumidithrix elongata RA019]